MLCGAISRLPRVPRQDRDGFTRSINQSNTAQEKTLQLIKNTQQEQELRNLHHKSVLRKHQVDKKLKKILKKYNMK